MRLSWSFQRSASWPTARAVKPGRSTRIRLVCLRAMVISPEKERFEQTSTRLPTASPAGKVLSWLLRRPKMASSAESVGHWWLWQASEVVIESRFHGLVGSESVGTSGHHSDLVVETLDGSGG